MTFHKSQDQEYLNLITKRAKQQTLTWVKQVSKLIPNKASVNDIGCCVGQLWRSLRDKEIDYQGYDIEQIYIDKALEIFPELKGKLHCEDITKVAPRYVDISVCSATLEHIAPKDVVQAIKNIGCADKVIIRTFIGKEETALVKKENAEYSYYMNQFKDR